MKQIITIKAANYTSGDISSLKKNSAPKKVIRVVVSDSETDEESGDSIKAKKYQSPSGKSLYLFTFCIWYI